MNYPTHNASISFQRRLCVIIYEALLVIAMAFLAVSLALAAAHFLLVPSQSLAQMTIFFTLMFYFTWSWSEGRRTLPMKTWKVKIVTINDQPVSWLQAFIRFMVLVAPWLIAASVQLIIEHRIHHEISVITRSAWALTALCFPWVWGIFHPQRLPLHEALSHTRLVRTE